MCRHCEEIPREGRGPVSREKAQESGQQGVNSLMSWARTRWAGGPGLRRACWDKVQGRREPSSPLSSAPGSGRKSPGAGVGQASPPPPLTLPPSLFPCGPGKTCPALQTQPRVASLLSARPSAPVPSGPSSDATSPRKTSLIKPAQLARPHLSAPNTQPWHLSLHGPGHSSGLVAQLLPFPHLLSFSFSWEGQAHGQSSAAGC